MIKNIKNRIISKTGLFLLLAAAGAGLNRVPLVFEMGQTLFLGGVFVLLIFMIYPLPVALIGSLLVNLAFWGTWRFFPFLTLSLCEVIFLYFARKRGYRNLVGMDGLFWLVTGLPLSFGVSRYFFHFSPGLSLALYSGLAVNGITCITLASLFQCGWHFCSKRIFKVKDRCAFPLRTILFNLVTLGILSLALLFYALENGRFIDRYNGSQTDRLEREAERMDLLIQKASYVSVSEYPLELSPFSIAVVEEGDVVRKNGTGDLSFFSDTPFLGELFRSGESSFLYETMGRKDYLPWLDLFLVYKHAVGGTENVFLILSSPLDSGEGFLQTHYIRTILVFLCVLYGAFLLALFLSSLLASPIIELSRIAAALSREETENLGNILWPVSTVQEIQDLVDYSKKSYGNMIERNVQLTSLNRSLEYSAHYDGLTKLPNRTLVLERLEEMIHDGITFALVFLDLDEFKMLNDTHGHRAGDLLLIEFAYRLTTIQKDDFAARLGGDEFALIMQGFGDRAELEERLALLFDKMAKPIDVNGELHVLHSSIGVALCPDHGFSVSALLRNADLAMYRVKSEGKNNWMVYNEELDNALTQYEMEKGVYKAFEEKQFALFYQPQVDIRTGDIISLEALIRWNHPEKGYISPSLFIPLAERMDIIIPIGYWVIEEAARKGKDLVDRGFKGVVSVNVSPRQFSESNFFHATKAILERIGLAPCHFGIEVTETMVMGNVSFTSKIISQFMKYGVRVSIDDFGTGYTSLSLLQDLNVHTLKIDQTFVEKVGQSRKNEIVLNNIIKLTRELEMDIVIEGVETEEQNSFFRDRACYTSQGFLYHKPLPSDELEKVLKEASDFK